MALRKLAIPVSLGVIATCLLLLHKSSDSTRQHRDASGPPAQPPPPVQPPRTATLPGATSPPRSVIKHRAGTFTTDEKSQFLANFETRYKPAILKWSKAFNERTPISPEDITPDKLVERIGRDASYSEYIFVLDGITLGVRDTKGVACVDYLNAPQQTRKLAALPDGTQAPVTSIPVTRQQIIAMLQAEGGRRFQDQDVRIVPSGLSGGLNGGALVSVGGDPENGASWDYDIVFGPEGKLAYYLKGNARNP